MYLFDTNIVINFLETSFSPPAMHFLKQVVDDQCYLSVITKIEALGFKFKNVSEQAIMEAFIDGSTILDLDNAIIDKAIEIRRSKKIRLPDAVIAATAIVSHLKLLTRNTSDFTNIPDLQIIDPGNAFK